MTVRGRDALDDLITTDSRWVSIVFGGSGSGSDWQRKNNAESWAKSEFGDGFFRFGNKFFFDDETKMTHFLLRWSC